MSFWSGYWLLVTGVRLLASGPLLLAELQTKCQVPAARCQQQAALPFDITGDLPNLGHNLFNIQVENISVADQDTSIHHDIAHV